MLETTGEEPLFDEAQLAVAAFLARYSGRTLDAYRFDLRAGTTLRRFGISACTPNPEGLPPSRA